MSITLLITANLAQVPLSPLPPKPYNFVNAPFVSYAVHGTLGSPPTRKHLVSGCAPFAQSVGLLAGIKACKDMQPEYRRVSVLMVTGDPVPGVSSVNASLHIHMLNKYFPTFTYILPLLIFSWLR